MTSVAVPWSSSGLDASIVQRIMASGPKDLPIVTMTEVQRQVLAADSSSDVLAIAPTGSGKTIAFLAPLLRDMNAGKVDGALLLSPTNPLRLQHIGVASQICPPTASVVKVESARGELVRGFVDRRTPSIIIATPSKWLDLSNPSKCDESSRSREYAAKRLSVIVLDEVDEMIRNPGFKRDVQKLIELSPNARVMSLTATSSSESQSFARQISKSAGRHLVEVDAVSGFKPNHTHESVVVKAEDIIPSLHTIVDEELRAKSKAIVFFPTALYAKFAHDYLVKQGIQHLHLLQSKMSKGAVRQAEARFRACHPCILFASNVISRGMDVPDTNVVVQVSVSQPEEYSQRVGRAGRAGRAGRGILLVTSEEAPALVNALSESRGVHFTQRHVVPAPNRMQEGSVPGADQAFKATLGAYKTLGWKMRDAISILSRVFVGAGQRVPTIARRTAAKLGIREGDGLDLVDDVHNLNPARHKRQRGGNEFLQYRGGKSERDAFVPAMVSIAMLMSSLLVASASFR
jgi:superfamily II DNA/RNA helicase